MHISILVLWSLRLLTLFTEGKKRGHSGAAEHDGNGDGDFHVIHGDGVFPEELWVVFELLFEKRLASDPPGVVEDVTPGEWVVAVGVWREEVVVLDKSPRTEEKGEKPKDEGGKKDEKAQTAHVQAVTIERRLRVSPWELLSRPTSSTLSHSVLLCPTLSGLRMGSESNLHT